MNTHKITLFLAILLAASYGFAVRAHAQGNAGVTYTSGAVTKAKVFNFDDHRQQ